MAVLTDLVRGLEQDSIRKIVLVNGHGGNQQAMEAFLRAIHGQVQAFVALVQPGSGVPRSLHDSLWERGSGIHAGESETSEILTLRPETVRMDRAVAPDVRKPRVDLEAAGAVYVKPWHHYSDTSGVGDPTRATAGKGRRWMEASAEALARFLKALSDCPWGEGFPFGTE